MFGQRGKAFDCIEHKRRVQKKLLQEYEARKDEFASCADFIYRTADESEEIRAWRERIAGGRKAGEG
jgi:hypothetical protein